MESYIQISKINDFIFCPKSLYFHSVYERMNEKTYHASPQTRGKIKHRPIDEHRYSTAKKHLQGLEVFSEKYGLTGKIDIYDQEKFSLIERKNSIKKIYDGYKFQLYAQCFCLQEMGFKVKSLWLYSMSDNKKHRVDLPDDKETKVFEDILDKIRNFDISAQKEFSPNLAKCANCIYAELCG